MSSRQHGMLSANSEVDTHPGTVACEAEALRKTLGAQLKTVSAR